jgi:hypothetical protein
MIMRSRSQSSHPLAVISVLLALGAVSPIASAQTAPSKEQAAKDHADKGSVFFNVQDWPSAIREYRESYELDPRPETLYALAQSQRQSGDCTSAIKSFRAYGRVATSPQQQAASEGMIHKCENEMADQQKKAAAVAPVAPVAGATPAPAESSTVAPAPAPATPPAHEEPEKPRPIYADVFGDVLFIGGLAVAGVGTFFLVSGDSSMSSSGNGVPYNTYESNVSSAKPKQAIGVGGIAVGGVLALCGVWRYVTVANHNSALREKENAGASASFLIAPQPSGAAAVVVGRF